MERASLEGGSGWAALPADDEGWHRDTMRRLYFFGTPGGAEAAAYVDSSTIEGWAVRMGFELGPDGTPEIEEVVFRRRSSDSAPAGGRLLRSLGLTRAVEAAEESMRDYAVATAFLGERWTDPIRRARPGRRGRDELEWALLARRYVEAVERNPRAPIKELHAEEVGRDPHVTTRDIRNRVNRCRPKYLTRGQQGKPGGELTDHAQHLLAAFDAMGGNDGEH